MNADAPTSTPVRAAAVIVAAGRGSRAGGDSPKQWQPLLGARVIDWTLAAFRAHPGIAPIVVVLHPDDTEHLGDVPDLILTKGGATRAASVRNGLDALPENAPPRVLIHDAARACVTPGVIGGVLDALHTHAAAAPGLAVTDALWSAAGERITGTVDRTGLYRAQTPQGFDLAAIRAAHAAASGDEPDDVTVARAAGIEVCITQGDSANLKITTPADFTRAEAILKARMTADTPDIRTGNGFDVHRFGPGDRVILCGVTVPHDRALQGHSDADVGLHAITDAVYGALAEGDIGRHFPPSDPQWKDADSAVFLAHAADRASDRGYRIANIDLTLICEVPKIGPHAAAMSTRVAEIAGTEASRVSIKATTSERLGFTGRGEGIAAMATITLIHP